MQVNDENLYQSTHRLELWCSDPLRDLSKSGGSAGLDVGLTKSLGLFEVGILLPVRIGKRNQSIPGCQPKRAAGRQRLSVLQSVFQISSVALVTNLPYLMVVSAGICEKWQVQHVTFSDFETLRQRLSP